MESGEMISVEKEGKTKHSCPEIQRKHSDPPVIPLQDKKSIPIEMRFLEE